MSRPPKAPTLEVLHRLPGRVRVGVRPVSGEVLEHLLREARRLRGVRVAEAGASGRNVVLCYGRGQLTEHALLMRLALALSARHGYAPVRLMQREAPRGVDRAGLVSGISAGIASLLAALSPAGALTSAVGWTAAVLTLATVGRDAARDLSRGTPRPEALSLLHLANQLRSPARGHGALLAWLLYNGKPLADHLRGATHRGVELQPVTLRRAVGEDSTGQHLELVSRPVRGRADNEGRLLTPATLASALIGYLIYSLKQDRPGASAAGETNHLQPNIASRRAP